MVGYKKVRRKWEVRSRNNEKQVIFMKVTVEQGKVSDSVNTRDRMVTTLLLFPLFGGLENLSSHTK
jgi:hypothetical protein